MKCNYCHNEIVKEVIQVQWRGFWYCHVEHLMAHVIGETDIDATPWTVSAELAALKAERDVLRKLLQEREWVRNVYGYKYCPECTEAEKDGHAKDCPYGAALHATEAKDVCPSCTWRGDVTLVNGVCPYCDVNWHALRDAEAK